MSLLYYSGWTIYSKLLCCLSSLKYINHHTKEVVESPALLGCLIPFQTTHAKNVSHCFNETVLLIPAGKFFHRFSTAPGSSEVRVSDRAAPLQLTRIQGSRSRAFQQGQMLVNMDTVSGSSSENIGLPDPEVKGFQTKGPSSRPIETQLK